MLLTTETVNVLLSLSPESFNALLKRGVFPTPTFCESFDTSGVAINGTPFNPGTPAYFSVDGK